MYQSPQQRQIAFCEICISDHPTGLPPTNEEVNYIGNYQIPRKYPNKNFPRNNKFNIILRFQVGPLN